MKIGQKGLQLIKDFEGWYSCPYKDPIGIPTIGYGFTYYLPNLRKVTMNDPPLTKAEGELMLLEIISNYEDDLNRLLLTKVCQNQFDALVSFTYNLGATNLGRSTLLKKVNFNPRDKSIAQEFLKWNRAGGKVLPGLTRRRQAESDLYFS